MVLYVSGKGSWGVVCRQRRETGIPSAVNADNAAIGLDEAPFK